MGDSCAGPSIKAAASAAKPLGNSGRLHLWRAARRSWGKEIEADRGPHVKRSGAASSVSKSERQSRERLFFSLAARRRRSPSPSRRRGKHVQQYHDPNKRPGDEKNSDQNQYGVARKDDASAQSHFRCSGWAGLLDSCHWLLVRVIAPRTPRGVAEAGATLPEARDNSQSAHA
jgi:hypothetical protein